VERRACPRNLIRGQGPRGLGRKSGPTGQQSTLRAQNRAGVTQALDRVREAARQRKKERFTALLHHISIATLRQAFYALQRKVAPGVDSLTWDAYEAPSSPGSKPSRTRPSGSVSAATVAPDVTYRRQTAGSGRWRLPPWRI